ncbi:MAG: hypothetical protein EA369_06230 [Bradymonadales bacterium]|nr:MAG: hypothetical protein EA369_06230 [Bradymonadales bacterium]
MEPLRGIEFAGSPWPRDLGVLAAWFLSLLIFSVFQTPNLVVWSGLPFLILYGAWAWPFLKAAVLFLVVAWIYSSVSLTPSGLLWLSLFVAYLVVYFAQFRIMIRNIWQFMAVVLCLSWGFELIQLFLVSQLYPGHNLNWQLWGSIGLVGFSHSVVALVIYPSVQRWVVS